MRERGDQEREVSAGVRERRKKRELDARTLGVSHLYWRRRGVALGVQSAEGGGHSSGRSGHLTAELWLYPPPLLRPSCFYSLFLPSQLGFSAPERPTAFCDSHVLSLPLASLEDSACGFSSSLGIQILYLLSHQGSPTAGTQGASHHKLSLSYHHKLLVYHKLSRILEYQITAPIASCTRRHLSGVSSPDPLSS